MNQKDFFQQLRNELKDHPFRDRFLEELEDHAEDLIENSKMFPKKITYDFMKKNFGTPKEVKTSFIYMMNPLSKLLIIFLYCLSIYTLFFIWNEMIKELIYLGDINLNLPPQGLFAGFINIFYETFAIPYSGDWNSYKPSILLVGLSLIFLSIRIKNRKTEPVVKIIKHFLTTNFTYIGLIVVFMILEDALSINENYNLLIGLNLATMISVFYTQYKGLTFETLFIKK